jgi:hemolysin D
LELSVSTIGSVVTPAEQLMIVVPSGDALEVEVTLQNKDVGFVRRGDVAQVKVHAFPFTQYGVVGATLTGIADDAQ